MMKILLIGAKTPNVGGTAISFGYLEKRLKENYAAIEVLDVGTYRSWSNIIKLAKDTLHYVSSADVVTLHLGWRALISYGIMVLLLCKIIKKPVVVRRFGGVVFSELSFLNKHLGYIAYKLSNGVLCQTKKQLLEANNFCNHAVWFPTSRDLGKTYLAKKTEVESFIFVGQVMKAKGINILLLAFDVLHRKYPQVKLNIYGPLVDVASISGSGVYYGGIIPSEAVKDTISENDVLVLPTFYDGEGYPGVIVEAFQTATPVITTDWLSIPEIVEFGGVLIKPKSVQDLYYAMESLLTDLEQVNSLREECIDHVDQFSMDSQVNTFIKTCRYVTNLRKK